MATYLTRGELDVLTALEGGQWKTPGAIADEVQLYPDSVRSILKALAHRKLTERGGWGDSHRWGEFRITEEGSAELEERRRVPELEDAPA